MRCAALRGDAEPRRPAEPEQHPIEPRNDGGPVAVAEHLDESPSHRIRGGGSSLAAVRESGQLEV